MNKNIPQSRSKTFQKATGSRFEKRVGMIELPIAISKEREESERRERKKEREKEKKRNGRGVRQSAACIGQIEVRQ